MDRSVITYFFFLFVLTAFALQAAGRDSAFLERRKQSFSLFSEYSCSNRSAEEVLYFMELKDVVHRYKEVVISKELKNGITVKEGDEIRIGLFDNETFSAVVTRSYKNVNESHTFIGLLDDSDGYFVFTTTGKRSLGSVFLPQRGLFYQIISDPFDYRHYLVEVAEKNLDVLGSFYSHLNDIPDKKKEKNSYKSGLPRNCDDLNPLEWANIDVMVVYTPAAMHWADFHGGGINNVIALAIANAQMVHDNSETYLTLTLVHSDLVDYEETGDSQIDLWRLIVSPDYNPYGNFISGLYIPGFMDEVHEWRDAHHADICALFTHTNDRGGVASALVNVYGSPTHAFAVTRVQQAANSYTLVHEMGHLKGAHHHKNQLANPGPNSWINWPENTWSAGWRWQSPDGSHYCTVMTYENGNHFEDGITHTRVPYFSNPELLVQDRHAGHPFYADNVRTIRKMKHVVAAYRTEGVPTVSTLPVSDVGINTAFSGGVVVADNDEPVLERGLVWDTTTYPNLLNYTGKTAGYGAPGEFSSKMTGLEPGTEYSVAAYVMNDAGISYGHPIVFRTKEVMLAHVITGQTSAIGHNFAVLKGEVRNTGNSKLLQRGVVWDSRSNPTVDSHKGISREGGELGLYSSRANGLRSDNTYFYRAYAVNEGGVNYGQLRKFTTLPAKVYPNPVSDLLTIAFHNHSEEEVQIMLFDLDGQLLIQKPVSIAGDVEKQLDLTNLPGGVYLTTIQSEYDFPFWRVIKVDD